MYYMFCKEPYDCMVYYIFPSDSQITRLLQMTILFILRFKTIVASEKQMLGAVIKDGFDSILQLKKNCIFPFSHGSHFPRQLINVFCLKFQPRVLDLVLTWLIACIKKNKEICVQHGFILTTLIESMDGQLCLV